MLGVLTTRVRLEERMLFEAFERRGIPFVPVDDRSLVFDLHAGADPRFDGVVNRIMSHTRSVYAARLFEAAGHRVVNSSEVIETCGDKVRTSVALVRAGLPTPRTIVAPTLEAALPAVETVGYPAVMKPVVGSWGRMLSKVNDRDAAETLVEHKQALRSPAHSVCYVQELVDKPGRDIRLIVLGDRVAAAVYRRSEHWITNTARGAVTERCPCGPELTELALQAAKAVGGGMVAVDLLERSSGELLVTEVNHTMEFHGLAEVAEVDIADEIAAHLQEELCR